MSPGDTTDQPDEMVVDCQECEFQTTVSKESGTLPAEVLRDHAAETGHKLAVSAVETD